MVENFFLDNNLENIDWKDFFLPIVYTNDSFKKSYGINIIEIDNLQNQKKPYYQRGLKQSIIKV